MKRKLILSCVVAALLVGLVGTWLAGNTLIAPAPQAIGKPPADLAAKEVQFASESGATIHGWYVAGRKGVGAVVLMHGVRANRLSVLDRARFLSAAGYAVLLFDFQAHGESTGKYITFGYLESKDAQAAVNWIRTTIPEERIGVIGISMGGAAAVLASPPLEVNGVVLEMVYPTINQAISNRLMMRLGNWAGVLTPALTWQLKLRVRVGAQDLRPIDHVAQMSVPKLFIAGAEDQHTTIEESRAMFQAAREPKELWVVEGAKHVDIYPLAKEEYERRVLGFFGRHLKS